MGNSNGRGVVDERVQRKTLCAGIDPGLDGGIGIVCSDTGAFSFIPTPTTSYKKTAKSKSYTRMYDVQGMVQAVAELEGTVQLLVIEDPYLISKGSVSALAGLGRCAGIYEAACVSSRIPHMLVKPSIWMRDMHKGTPSTDTKARSIIAVKRLLPGIDLRRTQNCSKDDHNKADALLLGLYGSRHLQGGSDV